MALGTGVLVWSLKDASFHEQQAVVATAQVTVVAQAVSKAQGRVTATVQAQNLATATAANFATATAQAPATAAAQALQATVGPFEQKADKLFSGSGQLTLKSSTSLSIKYADVSVRDAVIKAKFINPQDSNYHRWDYGFGFRDTGNNKEFRLFMVYGGYWELELVSGTKSGTTNTPIETIVSDGYFADMDVESGGSNNLALYIKGEKAIFFINNKFVATLDLSTKMLKGDVFIAAGFKSVDEVPGQSVRYEDFSVASLDDKGTSI